MEYLYLAHHGIKGQRWGVRRYQNPDGTLTEAGKKRYYMPSKEFDSKIEKYSKMRGKAIKIATATGVGAPLLGLTNTYPKIMKNAAKNNVKNLTEKADKIANVIDFNKKQSNFKIVNMEGKSPELLLDETSKKITDLNKSIPVLSDVARIGDIATLASGVTGIGSAFVAKHLEKKMEDLVVNWVNSDEVSENDAKIDKPKIKYGNEIANLNESDKKQYDKIMKSYKFDPDKHIPAYESKMNIDGVEYVTRVSPKERTKEDAALQALKVSKALTKDKILNTLTNEYYKYYKEWHDGSNISKSEFKSKMKELMIWDDNDREIDVVAYGGWDFFGGHSLTFGYDPIKNKVTAFSLEG